MRKLVTLGFVLAVMAAPALVLAQADRPFLSPMFGDNMVLQRGIADPVWGWTTPGAHVVVTMNAKTSDATADSAGKWMAKIGPFAAGGPYEMTISGPETVTLRNVLVGDVWICSGQSNMEFGIANGYNAQEEIAAAHYPQIRLFTVAHSISYTPKSTVSGKWDVCTPQTVSSGGWGGFSAVGYFFGRELYEKLHVPIGLIHTSWGGTIAEAWTSAEALTAMPDFRPAVQSINAMQSDIAKGVYDFRKAMDAWYAKNDPGSRNGSWAASAYDVSGWKSMDLPSAWERAGLPDFDGIVWFRKEVDLPAGVETREATLSLGPIDDRDTTWVNGVRVGGMDEYNLDRVYKVPAGTLKEGRNVIAVRVLDTGGEGGLYGQPDQLSLKIGDSDPIALTGSWQYAASVALAKTSAVPVAMANNPNVCTVLYNGMIAPVIPYGIKGAIWYQGESNAGRAYQYRRLLPTMIRDWRSRWGVGPFPFFIVQLANFMPRKSEPGDDAWAELREAQLMTAESLPNCGLAVAIDIGDANDIHPKDKQDVGRRLALDALATVYHEPVEYSGPLYKSMKREGGAIRLTFSHMGGGLVAKGDRLEGFAIAGPDRKFIWADARIDGDTIVVSSPSVSDPVAVRYAWASNPAANLYNRAGLPSTPFRTDSWPGITANAK